jgi:hypothetical protein
MHDIYNIKFVHYRVHNSPPPVPVLGHINPLHALLSYLSNIHFNTIVPSPPRSTQVASFLQISPPKPCMHLSYPPYMPHAPAISIMQHKWGASKGRLRREKNLLFAG